MRPMSLHHTPNHFSVNPIITFMWYETETYMLFIIHNAFYIHIACSVLNDYAENQTWKMPNFICCLILKIWIANSYYKTEYELQIHTIYQIQIF